jgi:hypothetical protein
MHLGENHTRRIGPKTIIVVAVALVLSALTVYTFYNINGHSLDVTDREVRLIVTDSMEGEPKGEYKVPTIQKDSLVMVKFLSDDEKSNLKAGDVIQFRYNGILNHHRVNETGTDYVITQGDNTSSKEIVQFSDIRGEVQGADHTAGVIFTFVKDYVYVIVAFIVVLFIGSLLIDEIRSEKQKERLE